MYQILLVRQGDKYTAQDVQAVINQLPGYDIITLTDQNDTPGQTRPLNCDLPGWWSKLELCAPENKDLRPFLYLDLDTLILGDIAQYFGGEKFKMVKDFMNWDAGNSSVMWIPDAPVIDQIWKEFMSCPSHNMEWCKGHGDQKFFSLFVQELWETPESGIVSYKIHGKEKPTGNIMQFHGKPKPCNADGWPKEAWMKIIKNC